MIVRIFLLSFFVGLVPIAPARAFDPEDLQPMFDAPYFHLTDQNNQPFDSRKLKGQPWVLSFVFTRCSGPCPLMFAKMAQLQKMIPDKRVKLVMISIDPRRDTPDVLKAKLAELGADESRWSFLTGEVATILRVQRELKLAHGSETELMHSDRFLLFDKSSMMVRRFDPTQDDELQMLAEASMYLANEQGRAHVLPLVNSFFNATSALLLIVGFVFIRSGNWKAHATCMVGALVSSSAFLVGYLLNQFLHGTRSSGLPSGGIKVAYLIMLFSHMVLAIVMLPMILLTLSRVLAKKWDQHRKIARPTLAIWIYVSVTGVLVYVALYHIFPRLT
jgi:cytochrome oxidase Cu insertion factor (SCO1/SenC/PrrC family)/uncharacterized membrane protein YozB (DUF420 family)